MSDIAAIAAGLSRDTVEDLTANWDALSQADPIPHWRENFPEDLEALGYAELRPTDQDDLEEPFAYERGIVAGGEVWALTPLGLAVKAHLEAGG
jgi:hypothetical protein